jgi:apolipoprotein D and lipocalin family protein
MKSLKFAPFLVGLLLAACSSGPPLTLAPSVDVNRYAGTWYVIAEIPYIGERGDVGNTVKYTPLPDGHILDEYTAHGKNFDAPEKHMAFDDTVVAGTHNALWRVRFFWPIFFSYPILDVDADYQVALVGYPDRSLGWIFSRKPEMSDAVYQSELAKFAAQGYDVSQFRRVAQRPDQIGLPGFQ